MNDSTDRALASNAQPASSPVFVAGIDGSEASYAAASWAADRAVRDGAQVVLVHAYQIPAVPSVAGPLRTPAQRRSARRRALRILDGGAKRVPAGVSVSLVAEEGAADRVLIEQSAAAELLVLGARPQHRHPHLRFIGSTATRCLRQAQCPVVLVPALPRARAADGREGRLAAESA